MVYSFKIACAQPNFGTLFIFLDICNLSKANISILGRGMRVSTHPWHHRWAWGRRVCGWSWVGPVKCCRLKEHLPNQFLDSTINTIGKMLLCWNVWLYLALKRHNLFVVFSDFMEMMMMQNAQMHQMVMQQMMLSAIPKNNSLPPISSRSDTPVKV